MTANGTVNCLEWMQNQKDQNPCTTAQEVGQLCDPGYTVSSTNFQQSQYVPNATVVNGCTCSWSFYNLLSACSFCVGRFQYTSWNIWTANCGSYASNTSYLPSGRSLLQGVPFWAAVNREDFIEALIMRISSYDPASTWTDSTFNITQAADIAAAAQPDVTGGPLPIPTMMASSSSNGSVGTMVGVMIGGIVIIIIGCLFIFCVVSRHRSQGKNPVNAGIPSFDAAQLLTVHPTWRISMQPGPFAHAFAPPSPASPYLTSPLHPTSNVEPRPSRISWVFPGRSNERHPATPIMDVADMISPFLVMSPSHQANRPDTAPLTGKATEALSERVLAPPGQRTRLNPPPYSASGRPGTSSAPATPTQRPSTKRGETREGMPRATTSAAQSKTFENINKV